MAYSKRAKRRDIPVTVGVKPSSMSDAVQKVADDRTELTPREMLGAIEYDVQALACTVRDSGLMHPTKTEFIALCKCVEYLAAAVVRLSAATGQDDV